MLSLPALSSGRDGLQGFVCTGQALCKLRQHLLAQELSFVNTDALYEKTAAFHSLQSVYTSCPPYSPALVELAVLFS